MKGEEALIRKNLILARAAQQDINSKIKCAIERKANYDNMRKVMRGVVSAEKASTQACYSSSLAPRNLSGAFAPGFLDPDAEETAVIVPNHVTEKPVKAVAGTLNDEVEATAKDALV